MQQLAFLTLLPSSNSFVTNLLYEEITIFYDKFIIFYGVTNSCEDVGKTS